MQTTTRVKGPYTGIGTSLVAGYKSWFVFGDANYGKTWPDMLNNCILPLLKEFFFYLQQLQKRVKTSSLSIKSLNSSIAFAGPLRTCYV